MKTVSYIPLPEQMDIQSLQVFQHAHDDQFHQDIFRMNLIAQIRHIYHHIIKIAGRFADFFDKSDHDEKPEAQVIFRELIERRAVDLFILALMLANRLEINLEEAYFRRIRSVEEQMAKKHGWNLVEPE